MIIACIILAIISLALGGYIILSVIRNKKNNALKSSTDSLLKDEDVMEQSSENPLDVELESITDNIKQLESLVEDSEKEEETTELKTISENGETRYIVIKYSKSFLAKLIQSDNETKRYYSQLKNQLLAYEGVKSRISWKWETFRYGKEILAKLRLRGKTLSLCLALNVDDYSESKFLVENLADIKSFADTPCMYRIKNERRLRYSAELITDLMQKKSIKEKSAISAVDYISQYPYEDTQLLIKRKLIKVLTDEDGQSGSQFKSSNIREKINVEEADSLMQDDMAVTLIEKSNFKSDRTKTGIINIDTISQYFSSGEVVTLAEIKKRVKGFNKQITFIKVLARGTLDKTLTIEADSFSLQAVKMIILTGGKAIRKS